MNYSNFSYKLVTGSSPSDLENKVREMHVSHSYVVCGGFFIAGGIFYQPMIKYDQFGSVSGSIPPAFINPR